MTIRVVSNSILDPKAPLTHGQVVCPHCFYLLKFEHGDVYKIDQPICTGRSSAIWVRLPGMQWDGICGYQVMTIDISNSTIGYGAHGTFGEGTCALELADYLYRLQRGISVDRHTHLSAHPGCVCPTIAHFIRSWNDHLESDFDRNRLLGPLIPRIVGTHGSSKVELRRSYLALDWYVREFLPAWLDLAGLASHAKIIRNLAEIRDFDNEVAAEVPLLDAMNASRGARYACKSRKCDVEPTFVRAAGGDAAWDAGYYASDNDSGESCRTCTYDAIYEAARVANAISNAVGETTTKLQLSAVALLERMIGVTE